MFKFCVFLATIILYCTECNSFGRGRSVQKPCKQYESKMPNFASPTLRISEQKCLEYTWKMFEREDIMKSKCERRLFVIRGHRSKPAEYPHMGALGWRSTENIWVFLCGSVLVSEKFLITVAHCTNVNISTVRSRKPSIVRLGTANIYYSKFERPEDVNIKNIIVYPQYKSPHKYFDIALIELEAVVKFNKFIQPACLWAKPDIDIEGKEFTVTGWGTVSYDQKISKDLLYAKLDIFNSSVCESTILHNRNWFGMTDHHICAGKLDGSVDTCNGDSGGPLQYKLNETRKQGAIHMVVGLTSFGSNKCAQENTPGVYTKVSYFINWIEKIVWPYSYRSWLKKIVY